ncbi:GNAT family N-acetyltransferase [Halobacteria archaeon AArc-dxtr1]|nr:GNAT family N-acetyltransferase [Halobacteria archaeon AArc-dxtr1]
MDLEYDLLGWPPDGPQLRLDHERFSYAGKFVMTNTGKAVVRAPDAGGSNCVDEIDDDVVAAVSFNEDRTDETRLWIRYVTVARDHRGEGIGPELVAFVRDRAVARGYDRLRIAVNNPFAYVALYQAGFGFTDETTGIAELVLEYEADGGAATDRTVTAYRDGLERFLDRDSLSEEERAFVEDRLERERPDWLQTTG